MTPEQKARMKNMEAMARRRRASDSQYAVPEQGNSSATTDEDRTRETTAEARKRGAGIAERWANKSRHWLNDNGV